MLEAGKSVIFTSAGTGGSELSMGALRKLVAGHASKALVFQYEGRSIRSGYHITEVKSGSFVALDCGANPESWHELFVQLLDVSAMVRTWQPASSRHHWQGRRTFRC